MIESDPADRPSDRLSRLLASICLLTLLTILVARCAGLDTTVAAIGGLVAWTVVGMNAATWGDPEPEDEY